MIESFEAIDRIIFFLINGDRGFLADQFFDWVSFMPIWIPVYLWAAFAVYRKYGKKIAIAILFCASLILISDQTCNRFKNFFHRYRPTHNLEISQKVHTVNNYKGGQFGFVSGHAANTSAFVCFLFMLLKPMRRGFVLGLMAWVLLIGLSRIYLGVHYPFDILGGYLVGSIYGLALGSLFVRYFSEGRSDFPKR